MQHRHVPAVSHIGFDYNPGPDGALRVIPYIDTIALTDLIDTFEISAGMQPAGGWNIGLALRSLRSESGMARFHGSSALTADHRTPVLVCRCGELGCGGLLTRITPTGNLVVWNCFGPPYNTDRDYRTFGPFLFNRDQYDKAIRALNAEVAAGE
ncbi:hypothetical protein ABZ412_34725 [Nocardia sp. NPDC005746]|uniref:hypothetical protein n=1 Tax=Nocardia sp. NPDC005746 TaxID=3157062 RepID=UPI0033EAE878